MSQGQAIPFDVAQRVAAALVDGLAHACVRIEIAGSLRRRKAQVHDIEIVAVPRWESRSTGDIWDTHVDVDVFEEAIDALLTAGAIAPRPVENHRRNGSVDVQEKLGPAFKALLVEGIPLDLFVVRPPATWGVIFALRTGPGDWNTKLVTDCQAISRRVRGGQVEAWDGATGRWVAVPTPEESDFFAAIGQPWIEPPDRHVSRVAIRRELAAAVSA